MVLMVYLIAHPQFRYLAVSSDVLSASLSVGEIIDGVKICQTAKVPAQSMTSLSLMASTYGRNNTGTMSVQLKDMQRNVIAVQNVDISRIEDGKYHQILLDTPIEGRSGETLIMTMTTQGCFPGNAITVYVGNTVTTGRFDIVQNISDAD